MLKIALCDDTPEELECLVKYIEVYKAASNSEIIYECFSSGTELLANISSGSFYNLIFLDVVMPAINGIDVAKEIYEKNKVTQFVFLTISPEFAVDSYSVSALDYILKPINEKNFKRAMNKFTDRYKQKEEAIIIHEKSSIIRIMLYTLCYVEVLDHYLLYHLSNSNIIRCRQSLAEIEDILKRNSSFVKTHRSYIVNMDYIQKIEPSYIIMANGDRVSVSRANSKLVSDLFLKYKFEKGGK